MEHKISKKIFMKNILPSILFLSIGFASVRCGESSAAAEVSTSTGVGGSLARFTILGNYLYTVDFQTLKVFDITNSVEPRLKKSISVSGGVETIFPLGSRLFLGTQTGMVIYDIDKEGIPQFVSLYQHITRCDPVVANAQYAYVTLRTSNCRIVTGSASDQLEIIDISDPQNPKQIAIHPLTEPRGLGLDGNILFVCDSNLGVKIYNVSNPTNIELITELKDIIAHDVIVLNGLLLVIGPDNIYQYDYSDLKNIRKLSQMPLGV